MKGPELHTSRVLPEAFAYFRGRAAKNGLTLVLKLKAIAAAPSLALKDCGDEFASDARLDAAQEMLSSCEDLDEKVGLMEYLSILHLHRDNTHRALRHIKEAVTLARKHHSQHLISVLRTQELAHLLREDTAAAGVIAKEIEDSNGNPEKNPQLQHLPYLDLLRKVLQPEMDDQGRLSLVDFLVMKLKSSSEALALATEVCEESLHPMSQGMSWLFAGKMQLRSSAGLLCFKEAVSLFGAQKATEAEATALHGLATCLLLQERPDPSSALDCAQKSQVFFQELCDLRGEAISLQTASNCRLLLKDHAGAVAAALKAAKLFAQAGDEHGKSMVRKLLRSLGQNDQQIEEALSKQAAESVAHFDGVAGKEVAKDMTEEQRQRDEYIKTIMEEQVVFEYVWVPSETQDPKHFGEKRASGSGPRKIFVASELRDKRLMQQLAACRAKREVTPFFANLMNGRLLVSSSLQAAMEVSACASVIFDVTRLNNMTPLEVVDVAIRLVQALQVIEPVVTMDVVLASTQNISSVTGIRTPFHSTLWGFCRTANIENPMHEFRVLDIDAKRWKEDIAFTTRYLMGAQATRPTEAIIRNGGLLVSRMVSARMKLQAPYKIDG
ncbi:unnamed protein product [Durusdinium trenchii]|uniref:Uncharacterized protein n=2 Tax=Durusdinium trenchii TaxID=1381693 RepID=A0ABP0MU39_9DINO